MYVMMAMLGDISVGVEPLCVQVVLVVVVLVDGGKLQAQLSTPDVMPWRLRRDACLWMWGIRAMMIHLEKALSLHGWKI